MNDHALHLEIATAEERESLFSGRAKEWKGELTENEFFGKDRALYAHPYGRDSIRTWVLKNDQNQILCSMDTLDLQLMQREAERQIEILRGILIASVWTPEVCRRRGYASKLLAHYFENSKVHPSVLYSDIGPDFYERFGYFASPVTVVQEKTKLHITSKKGRSLTLRELVEKLGVIRREILETTQSASVCILPDEEMVDWRIEKFRYFAQEQGRRLEGACAWEYEHSGEGHLVWALPHFGVTRLYGMWTAPECSECVVTLHGLAKEWELQEILYWQRNSGKTGPVPMVKHSDRKSGLQFVDCQFGDWW